MTELVLDARRLRELALFGVPGIPRPAGV